MFQDLSAKVKEVYEKVKSQISGTSNTEESNLGDHTSREDGVHVERSTADVFTDFEFRRQLMEEEAIVLSQVQRERDRGVGQEDESFLSNEQVIDRMDASEKQFYFSLSDEFLRQEVLVQKRRALSQTNESQTNSNERGMLYTIVPPNIKPGEVFRVLIPVSTESAEERQVFIFLEEGKYPGDRIHFSVEDDILTKGKFLDEMPEDIQQELLQDAEMQKIFSAYQELSATYSNYLQGSNDGVNKDAKINLENEDSLQLIEKTRIEVEEVDEEKLDSNSSEFDKELQTVSMVVNEVIDRIDSAVDPKEQSVHAEIRDTIGSVQDSNEVQMPKEAIIEPSPDRKETGAISLAQDEEMSIQDREEDLKGVIDSHLPDLKEKDTDLLSLVNQSLEESTQASNVINDPERIETNNRAALSEQLANEECILLEPPRKEASADLLCFDDLLGLVDDTSDQDLPEERDLLSDLLS